MNENKHYSTLSVVGLHKLPLLPYHNDTLLSYMHTICYCVQIAINIFDLIRFKLLRLSINCNKRKMNNNTHQICRNVNIYIMYYDRNYYHIIIMCLH